MGIDLELWARCDGPDCQREVKSSRDSINRQSFERDLIGMGWGNRYGKWYCRMACLQAGQTEDLEKKFVAEWHQSLQDVCAENGFDSERFARKLLLEVMTQLTSEGYAKLGKQAESELVQIARSVDEEMEQLRERDREIERQWELDQDDDKETKEG